MVTGSGKAPRAGIVIQPDCFKYRNKIGLDVAMEALREALRERKCTVDGIWRYAKICRVANIMRPYMEALP